MDVNLGLSANGGVSKYLWINLWPTEDNLVRLEAVAVHELNHNLRYTTARAQPGPMPCFVVSKVRGFIGAAVVLVDRMVVARWVTSATSTTAAHPKKRSN